MSTLLKTYFVANALLLSTAALAQSYPEKPIRLIVPNPPGGATEILARTIGPKLTEAWGQPVVVDNRPGAGGTLGANLVARSRADGHTLVLGSIGNMVISTSVYPDIPYDTLRDFSAVVNLVNQPIVLVAHPTFAPNTVSELIAYAKTRPGQVVYGSTGIGGAMHIAGEMLQTHASLKLVHVPYKGGGPSLIELLGGQIPMLFVGLAPALPHIRTGKIKAIAAVGSQRASVLPNLPTVGETLPGYQVNYWSGLFAPSATPRAIVTQLNREIVKILRTPEIKKRLEDAGFEIVANTSDQFTATVRGELDKWGRVVRLAGIKPE